MIKVPPLLLLFISSISFCQDWDTLNKNAIDLYRTGEYDVAIAVADKALAAAASQYGKKSLQYATTLSNKAYAEAAVGDYLTALDNYRYVAQVCFELYPLPHVDQMQALGELAKIFTRLGAYDSAQHYISFAEQIYLAIHEQNRRHYDTSLFAVEESFIIITSQDAAVHHRLGQIDEAIQLLESQIPIFIELYPDTYQSQRDYHTTINNLFTYNNEAMNLESAKAYAFHYYSLTQGKGTAERVHALQNLGSIYNNLEAYDSALYYWHRALSTIEGTPETNSYVHTAILNNMGTLMLQDEMYDSAIFYLKKSYVIQSEKEALQPNLYQITLFNLAESYRWSEAYAMADSIYATLIDELLDEITHNFTYLSDNEKMSFYKNQLGIISEYASFQFTVSGALPFQDTDEPYLNPQFAGNLYDLQLSTKAIILNSSKRMKASILNSGNSRLIETYTLWEEQKNLLAQALVNANLGGVDLARLKNQIEENEKWLINNSSSFRSGFEVEQVRWQDIQKSLKPGEAAVEIIRLIDGLLYGALILTPETQRQPIFSLVMSTKSKHLEQQFYKNYYNSILKGQEDSLSYQTYWQPIMDSIQSHMPAKKLPQRIYLSNDGVYNLININTLIDLQGNYMLDLTDVVVLTNTKEVLTSKKAPISTQKSYAALFGRPAYSVSQKENENFVDLPGTGKEVLLIKETLSSSQWKTEMFTGLDASEKTIKTLKDPKVVHLASHGYFSEPQSANSYSLAETMIRSGIAMAGANDPAMQDEDGILTAYEVIALDLDATELVVLSACETGKGVINQGEGVYGLQRAFRVAGANHLVMSLWKVDDTATQELMVHFYKQWTATGDMRGAFRQAQRELRKSYSSPYYWGAFILTGN